MEDGAEEAAAAAGENTRTGSPAHEQTSPPAGGGEAVPTPSATVRRAKRVAKALTSRLCPNAVGVAAPTRTLRVRVGGSLPATRGPQTGSPVPNRADRYDGSSPGRLAPAPRSQASDPQTWGREEVPELMRTAVPGRDSCPKGSLHDAAVVACTAGEEAPGTGGDPALPPSGGWDPESPPSGPPSPWRRSGLRTQSLPPPGMTTPLRTTDDRLNTTQRSSGRGRHRAAGSVSARGARVLHGPRGKTNRRVSVG